MVKLIGACEPSHTKLKLLKTAETFTINSNHTERGGRKHRKVVQSRQIGTKYHRGKKAFPSKQMLLLSRLNPHWFLIIFYLKTSGHCISSHAWLSCPCICADSLVSTGSLTGKAIPGRLYRGL